MSKGRRLIGANVFKNPARYLKRTPKKVSTLFKNAGDILLFYSALPHSIKGSKVKVLN